MSVADQLIRIIDERVADAVPDPHLVLDLARGTVESVSAVQRLATVRLGGAAQSTSGVVLHPGLGVIPTGGDECVVLRRGDGIHLMIAVLGDLPADDVTGLPSVVLRASGGDDAPAFRAAIAEAGQGTRFILPDPVYLWGSGVSINKSNVYLQGRGSAQQAYGGTVIKATAAITGAMLQWIAPTAPPYAGAPLTGGGMRGVTLDGQGLPEHVLHLRTVGRLLFEDCWFANGTVTGLLVDTYTYESSWDLYNVVNFCTLRDIFIYVSGSAKGIHLSGSTTWAHKMYGSSFDNVTVSHDSGVGYHIEMADDLELRGLWDVQRGSGDVAEFGEHVGSIKSYGGAWPGNDIVARADVNVHARSILLLGMGTEDVTGYPTLEKGAQVRWITDKGFHTLEPDPRAYACLRDDFVTSGTGAQSTGELDWTLVGGTIAYVSSVADHFGIRRLDTGAVIDTVAGLVLQNAGTAGLVLPSEGWSLYWIFRLNSTADIKCRLGLLGAASEATDPPTDGIYAEYIAGTDTTWQLVTRASSTETRTDSGVTVGTDWVKIRLKRRTPADIGIEIGNVTNDFGQAAQYANVPTATLNPGFILKNTVASAKTADLDLFQYTQIGMDR